MKIQYIQRWKGDERIQRIEPARNAIRCDELGERMFDCRNDKRCKDEGGQQAAESFGVKAPC